MDNKICTKCGIEKPANEYKLNRGRLRSECKECNKIYRTDNREAINRKKSEYYKRHQKETMRQKIARLEAEIQMLKAYIVTLQKE
jgi:hypothetical protein